MTGSRPDTPPAVRLRRISKSFGPVTANQDIDLDIRSGRIHALLGENGAGKSTLMSILAGRLQPDSGQILMDGRPVTLKSEKEAIRHGIGMVYQHFMLVDAMSVTENAVLGQETAFRIDRKRLGRKVQALGRTVGLDINPHARVSTLSMGEKQRVEILKLLLRDSRMLIFDEPTAVLTPSEIDQLFSALRQMARQGRAIVFITHKLSEVMALADDITILRKGRVIDHLAVGDVVSQADLARRMVGREVMLTVNKPDVECRQRVLRIEALSGGGLDQIRLDVRQGEIVGIVGVAGNGQKQLVETVCGLRRPQQGQITILGEPWPRFHGRRISDGALCYIPEDRQGQATCSGLDLHDNFLVTTRYGFCRGPWIRHHPARARLRELIDQFDIHPPRIRALARQLSGGNLQKLVLAREFHRRPRLIIAEQPTQGLDIGATEDVWDLLIKARERAGILLVTGDINEALTLSDRIAVMFAGRIAGLFSATDTAMVRRIGAMMAGVDTDH